MCVHTLLLWALRYRKTRLHSSSIFIPYLGCSQQCIWASTCRAPSTNLDSITLVPKNTFEPCIQCFNQGYIVMVPNQGSAACCCRSGVANAYSTRSSFESHRWVEQQHVAHLVDEGWRIYSAMTWVQVTGFHGLRFGNEAKVTFKMLQGCIRRNVKKVYLGMKILVWKNMFNLQVGSIHSMCEFLHLCSQRHVME